jgi:hypothetical protein
MRSRLSEHILMAMNTRIGHIIFCVVHVISKESRAISSSQTFLLLDVHMYLLVQ